jgi:hypothetical protein
MIDMDTIEVRKCCMLCAHIDDSGCNTKCDIRTEIDILTVPYKRCCDSFKLNPEYEV